MIQSQDNEEPVPARINHIIHLGWEIQVELLLESGQIVNAHLNRKDFDSLHLTQHQQVYVKLKQVTTFSEYALN